MMRTLYVYVGKVHMVSVYAVINKSGVCLHKVPEVQALTMIYYNL